MIYRFEDTASTAWGSLNNSLNTIRRFHPALHRVREVVKSGELGKVKHAAVHFAIPSLLAPLYFEKDDIRFSFNLGGGCMMDMGGAPSLDVHVQGSTLTNNGNSHMFAILLPMLHYSQCTRLPQSAS